MPVTVAASRLGTAAFDQSPVELRANYSRDDAQTVIRAVYRQVLGNDYIMSSERLTAAESLFTNGFISVRDFVRAVAQSELYKQKFLYNNFQTRVIELNFKHLLGRAPYDEAEVIEHLDRYQNNGFEADINSYIDSAEYTENFGDNIVPYIRSYVVQTGHRTVGFTRMFSLQRGYANSDRAQIAGSASRLAQELARNTASAVVGPSGVNEGWAFRTAADDYRPGQSLGGSTGLSADDQIVRVEVAALSTPRYPRIRRSSRVFFVPVSRLSQKLQEIQRMGGRVASISPAGQ
ncbi:phycocyanin-associated rod linker protein [[Synechococcus] sp. NIES-970]|uniref:phycobilisome linker polypeptide n=1 Tax=Picosynechococcus sp. NKBG15041c TaxID=1407650 RepID=UPI0004231614|nr:phycobilisome linker polypeptide [Picosynechococcus sp. NKBG15041c]BAW97399.1 phycocyanin-associated rod linker protein [[Synechococcus] sp. NIES-970]